MSTNDGIHYDRWQRSRELDAALQAIITQSGLDVGSWKSEWWQDPRPQSARKLYHELVDALVQATGCEPATAEGHVSKLLRIRK